MHAITVHFSYLLDVHGEVTLQRSSIVYELSVSADWVVPRAISELCNAAMAQRKSELLRLQTLERIAGFQQDLEAQLQIMLSNPELTSLQQSS